MNTKNLTTLYNELERVSKWIEFADQKAGFLGLFYSAIVGFILTQKSTIVSGLSEGNDICTLILVVLLLIVVFSLARGIYFLYRTVLPQLENGNTNNSLFYFGNVAKKKISDYLLEVKDLDEERMMHEIAEQIHTNSVIADKKMSSVKKSTKWLFTAFVVFVALMIIL